MRGDFDDEIKTGLKSLLLCWLILHYWTDDVRDCSSICQEESGTDWKEMYQVFNMGHRMELYVEPQAAESIIEISKSFNVDAKIIGRVEESDEKILTIKSEFGTFNYH